MISNRWDRPSHENNLNGKKVLFFEFQREHEGFLFNYSVFIPEGMGENRKQGQV